MRGKCKKLGRMERVVLKRRIMIIVGLMIFLLGSFVYSKAFMTKAQSNTNESPVNYKYYKSVEIKEGDTLWDIAKTYMNKESDESVQDYIDELKRINNLETDNIHDSNFLTVAYYDTTFK